MKKALQINKVLLAATMAVFIVGGVIYFVFQEFTQLENQLASLREQIAALEDREPTAPATSTPASGEFELVVPQGGEPSPKLEENINLCDSLNCNELDGWTNSGSTFTCQNESNKTCTCQAQAYFDYSCSSLKQKCVYLTTNTRTNKYNCVEPVSEPASETKYPDLIVQSPGFSPAVPTVGSNMAFWATIKDGGEASSASSLSYVNIDGTKIAEFSTAPLTNNGSIVVTGSTVWSAIVGEHTLKVCADGNSAINESNELNNCTTTTFIVKEKEAIPQPDLVIQSLSISPASTTAGQSVTFGGTVKNQGGTAAGASLSLLFLDLNNNGTWDFSLGAMGTAALDIDSTKTEVWFNAWTAAVGTHQFKICADVDYEVTESNETNNCSPQVFTVQ